MTFRHSTGWTSQNGDRTIVTPSISTFVQSYGSMKLRPQVVTGAVDPFLERYAERSSALAESLKSSSHWWNQPHQLSQVRLAVERAGAGDRDVGAAVRVDERRVVQHSRPSNRV